MVLAMNLTGGSVAPGPPYVNFYAVVRFEGLSRAVGKIIFISSVHEIPWAGHVDSPLNGGLRIPIKILALELRPAKHTMSTPSPWSDQDPDPPEGLGNPRGPEESDQAP